MKRLLFAALLSLVAISPALAQVSDDSPDRNKVPAVLEIDVTLAEWTGDPVNDAGLSGTTDEVVERVKALEKKGALTVVQRFRITTVDGQSATAQQGENRPRVTGSTSVGGARGMTANQVSYSSTGTLVGVTAGVRESHVILELNVERSAFAQRPDAPVLSETPMGEKTRAESTTTLRISSTLRLTSGQTALLVGISNGGERQVALVGVKVVK